VCAAAALDKAEPPLRDPSIKREIELTLAPLVPPIGEQIAEFMFLELFLRLHRYLRTGWDRPLQTTDGPCLGLCHPGEKCVITDSKEP